MVPQVRAMWIAVVPINEKGPKELCPASSSPTVLGHQDLSKVADNSTLHEALSGKAATVGILLCYPLLGAQSLSPE